MQLMLKQGIRGENCYSVKRHVITNKPNIENLIYCKNRPITWLTYLDCVNLYGKSMLSS
jgi:hypothetical protein